MRLVRQRNKSTYETIAFAFLHHNYNKLTEFGFVNPDSDLPKLRQLGLHALQRTALPLCAVKSSMCHYKVTLNHSPSVTFHKQECTNCQIRTRKTLRDLNTTCDLQISWLERPERTAGYSCLGTARFATSLSSVSNTSLVTTLLDREEAQRVPDQAGYSRTRT